MIKFLRRRQTQFVKHTFNELYFHINEKTINRLRIFGHFLGIIVLTATVIFIFLNNTTPFGITVTYDLQQKDKNISPLGPKNRLEEITKDGQTIFKQKDDFIYFSTALPFIFDQAVIRLIYKNPNGDQTVSLGFQDGDGWHYNTKPFDVPYLNSLSWIKNGYNPVLYQREQRYISAEAFLNNPPHDGVIGTYEYQTDIGDMSHTHVDAYVPKKEPTLITTPLRGKHTLYAYLKGEPFIMNILKQDLNWYQGIDPMTVKIYKDGIMVHEVTAEDDGIEDNSQKVLPPQEVQIKNPGEEFPESGVYKIVIESTDDTIIRSIATNLHKIVFANSLFPITNSHAYPGIVASTSATIVYTNALNLSAATYHSSALQNILVGDQILGVQTLNTRSFLSPKENIARVLIPQNDVIIKGFMGYFAFSEDQFFLPTSYYVLPISKKEDIDLVDYILTDYRPPVRQQDGWTVNEQLFDLKTAYIQNGRLNWVIKAPKLKAQGKEFIIKDIQVTFHKKAWM